MCYTRMCSTCYALLLLFLSITRQASSLSLKAQTTGSSNRRVFLSTSCATIASATISSPAFAAQAAPDLTFSNTASGLQWADAKVGTGSVVGPGSNVAIDYVLSTTGARYGSKIYGSAERGEPYRFKLGDGSTIAGIEEAILGSGDMPAMRPGGIRRLIIPSKLAYGTLGTSNSCSGIGPIPPVPEAFEEFQRFKNIYCNPQREYQPDVVMDVKLYGKRTLD